MYTHRIGRKGRAGKTGVASTFFTLHDSNVFYELKQMLIQSNSPVPPELARLEASKFKPGTIPDRPPRRNDTVYAHWEMWSVLETFSRGANAKIFVIYHIFSSWFLALQGRNCNCLFSNSMGISLGNWLLAIYWYRSFCFRRQMFNLIDQYLSTALIWIIFNYWSYIAIPHHLFYLVSGSLLGGLSAYSLPHRRY